MAAFWVLAVGAAAVVLFVSAHLSFDDCSGRISDWQDLPGPLDDLDSNAPEALSVAEYTSIILDYYKYIFIFGLVSSRSETVSRRVDRAPVSPSNSPKLLVDTVALDPPWIYQTHVPGSSEFRGWGWRTRAKGVQPGPGGGSCGQRPR